MLLVESEDWSYEENDICQLVPFPWHIYIRDGGGTVKYVQPSNKIRTAGQISGCNNSKGASTLTHHGKLSLCSAPHGLPAPKYPDCSGEVSNLNFYENY